MSKFKFKAEDFANRDHDTSSNVDLASMANAKLAKWLKDAPTIYSEGFYHRHIFGWQYMSGKNDKQKAKLVEIEELTGTYQREGT